MCGTCPVPLACEQGQCFCTPPAPASPGLPFVRTQNVSEACPLGAVILFGDRLGGDAACATFAGLPCSIIQAGDPNDGQSSEFLSLEIDGTAAVGTRAPIVIETTAGTGESLPVTIIEWTPNATGFDPATGTLGTEVTIRGTGLAGASFARLSHHTDPPDPVDPTTVAAPPPVRNTDTELTFAIPDVPPGRYDVQFARVGCFVVWVEGVLTIE
jgi:IPT/TIG domain